MDPLPEPLPLALANAGRAGGHAVARAVAAGAARATARSSGRKVAMLVAPRRRTARSLSAVQARAGRSRARWRACVGPRIGRMPTADGDTLDADASLENEPGFLFDALVLPDGAEAVAALAQDGHTMEFIKDQFRHCKTILRLGASRVVAGQGGSAGEHGQEPCPGRHRADLRRRRNGRRSGRRVHCRRCPAPPLRPRDGPAAALTRPQTRRPMMPESIDKDACELLDADHLAVKHLFVEYARLAYAPDASENGDRAAIAMNDMRRALRARADRGGDLLSGAAPGRSERAPTCWTRPRKSTSRPRR